jgi:putative transposase
MVKKRKPAVADELLDELLGSTDALGAFQSGDLIQDLIQDLKKALAERILNAGLEHHLDDEEQASGNHSSKRIITDDDTLDLSIPHDRQDQFEPKLIEKHSRR